MDDRRERIQLLARVNRREKGTPQFLAELTEVLGEHIEETAIAPINETDILDDAFKAGYQTATRGLDVSYRRLFRADEKSAVLRLALCLGEKLSNVEVFFLSNLGTDRIAFKTKALALLTNAESVIGFDGDSASALSADSTQGLLIDHNSDDRDHAYEVTVWGGSWPLLVLECDQTPY